MLWKSKRKGKGEIFVNKLTKAYLSQGNNKFESIVAVELAIKKSFSIPKPLGCDVWEIFLDMDDVWGLYKAWKKNPVFELYIEYSAKENEKTILETVCGKIQVTDIAPSKFPHGPHSVRGVAKSLKMSSKEAFVREKVQFD